MSILSEILSWWGGNTWGTRITVGRQGRFVGKDEYGNRYYIQRSGVGPLGVPRRWVIYERLAEPSQIPAEWHAWMHYTVDSPPNETSYVAKPWQLPHRMNMTGTDAAYRPTGSIVSKAERPKATGDYQAWRPK